VFAGLQVGLHPPRSAAAHQAEMAAMLVRQRFENRAGLAMRADGEHDGVIGPFHFFVLAARSPQNTRLSSPTEPPCPRKARHEDKLREGKGAQDCERLRLT